LSTIVNAKTKQRRGTELSIPTLLAGELYLPTDKRKIYKGTSTGNVLVGDMDLTDKNTGDIAKIGNKNYCINGNFDIWQRGASFTNPISSTQFTADRFLASANISGTSPTNLIHSKISMTGEIDGTTTAYRFSSDGSGVLNSGDFYRVMHAIENGTRKLCGNGKKITVSFWARSSIANKKIGIYGIQNYGTGGSPSTSEILQGKNVVLTNTWQKITHTFNTNTLIGKTFGTNIDDNFRLCFMYAYGVTLATNVNDTVGETFGGTGTIDIAQIKIESGDVVTPFVPLSVGEELKMCQRYFETSVTPYLKNLSIALRMITGIPFTVTKRVNPNIKIFGANTGVLGKVMNVSGVDVGTNIIASSDIYAITQVNSDVDLAGTVGDYRFRYEADSEIY